MRDRLLESAILDHFRAPLCDAICMQRDSTELVGGRFIELLRNGNLFVIPLDSKGKWFRYHPLFQHLMQHHG